MLGVYGVFQERIMTIPYEGELFVWSLYLVLLNRIVGVVYAVVMALAKRESLKTKAPFWKYCLVSMSNLTATTCQYMALQWVSFPILMLGKSFKMLPVMCWNCLISKKKYSIIDWCIALCISSGITVVLCTGEITGPQGNRDTAIYGLLLIAAFIFSDGFTSSFQEKIFREEKTSTYNQMLYVNMASTVIALIGLLAMGQLFPAMAFSMRHQQFVYDAFWLSGASAANQFFMYDVIANFGAVYLAATMNVRQVCSIMLSYAMYAHAVTQEQVFGLAMVIGGIFLKAYYIFKEKKGSASSSSSCKLSQDKILEKEKLLP